MASLNFVIINAGPTMTFKTSFEKKIPRIYILLFKEIRAYQFFHPNNKYLVAYSYTQTS